MGLVTTSPLQIGRALGSMGVGSPLQTGWVLAAVALGRSFPLLAAALCGESSESLLNSGRHFLARTSWLLNFFECKVALAAVAETVAAGGAHASLTSTIVGPPLGPDFSEAPALVSSIFLRPSSVSMASPSNVLSSSSSRWVLNISNSISNCSRVFSILVAAAVPAISAACAPEDLAPADVALAPADEDEQADAEDLVHVL